MEFLAFLPEGAGFILHARLGSGHHSEPMFALSRLLPTSPDLVLEILFGNGVIGFGIVGANTGTGPNELTDQWRIYRIERHLLHKANDRLPELRGSFLQVELVMRPFLTIII